MFRFILFVWILLSGKVYGSEEWGEKAFSTSFRLKRKDVALKSGAVKIVSVKPICPRNVGVGEVGCLAQGSVVKLEILLDGCFDRLGPVYSQFIEDEEGVVKLFVAAIGIVHKNSADTVCLLPNIVYKSIFSAHEKEKIELVTMEGDFFGARPSGD